MSDLIFYVVNGLSLGVLYGMIALGFVIIHKASGVLNFAHGAFVLIGVYVVARLAFINFPLAVVAGIVTIVLLALAVERFLVRTMAGRAALSITIMTIGLDIVLLAFARSEINTQIVPLGDPWGGEMVSLLGVSIPLARLVALGVGVVIAIAFFIWQKYSSWGTAFRAATERRDIAVLMGIDPNRLAAVSWALAGAFAVIAGVFLVTFPTPGVSLDLGTIALTAFPAAVIGGINSPHGAIIGGLLVGVLQLLAQGYQQYLSFLGNGFHEVLTYVLMIIVLLVRPNGLFGHKEVKRA